MDFETEKVIELLFPEGIPESWKEDPELYQYLSSIGKYDVSGLMKEPNRLVEEKNFVEQSTQDLVFSNYKTFILTAENSRQVHEQFNETKNKLDDVVNKIPKFVENCKLFCNISQDINTRCKLNTLTLSKTGDLIEILALPQLMKNCLQNGLYNEALELTQYARHLNKKHKDIRIVASIVSKIEMSWSNMVNQVIESLKMDLPLPKCLQLIGLLRSMDVFTESELRIKFLQARGNWLQNFLDAIPKEDATTHMTKTIELSRIHLFNIITQYKAMFSDDVHLSIGRDGIINDAAILYEWLEEKVSAFIKTLQADLPNITSIDSVLGQCTYFLLSFGRVGADFTGSISTIFIDVIKTKFENNVLKATKNFEKDIEGFSIHKHSKLESKLDIVINSENPPELLVDFYPLAKYCNGLTESFNELRSNVPVALAQNIKMLLQISLHTVSKIIASHCKKQQNKFPMPNKNDIVKLAEVFSEQFVPYIQYCIHALFPPTSMASCLGISVSQLQKEEVTYLNQKYITEPLSPFLPTKIIPVDIFEEENTISHVYDSYDTNELSNSSKIVPESNSDEPALEKKNLSLLQDPT